LTRILPPSKKPVGRGDSQTQAGPIEAPRDGAIGLCESLEDGFLFSPAGSYARIFYLELQQQVAVGWRFVGDQTHCLLLCKM
jgi:hypothetical protein